MKKITESSPARIAIFVTFILLIGSSAFLAWRAQTNLAASYEVQITLAQQAKEVRTAGSMNDIYSQSWLADDQNFSELGGYVNKLLSLSASPSLDPTFKRELNDYIWQNRSRLPEESAQIKELSFSEGILRQDQSRLLEMYDTLGLVFQTMDDILVGWDLDMPQMRGEKMFIIQDAFEAAKIEFQATRSSHKKILNYASQLDQQSKQNSATELDKIHSNLTLFKFSILGLIVSIVLFVGWVIFLAYHRRRAAIDHKKASEV